nr:rubredoxin [Synechococcus sp. UW140]
MSDEISGPKAAAPAEASGTEAEVTSTTVTTTESPTPESSTAAEESTTDPRTHRFECRSCGYVYDPAEGVKKLGIDSGTAFEDLDAIRFRCPVCRSKVGAFRDIGPSTKPSGFEENLNYGLGVNRLTPGQKNVLIFGSMALAFAFFLSLYSLR